MQRRKSKKNSPSLQKKKFKDHYNNICSNQKRKWKKMTENLDANNGEE
jgi:hypothetical protein